MRTVQSSRIAPSQSGARWGSVATGVLCAASAPASAPASDLAEVSAAEGSAQPAVNEDFMARFAELFGNHEEQTATNLIFSLSLYLEARRGELQLTELLKQYGGEAESPAQLAAKAEELNTLGAEIAKKVISSAGEKGTLVDEATVSSVARSRELARDVFHDQLSPVPMTPEEVENATVKELAKRLATMQCTNSLRDLSGASKATLDDSYKLVSQLGEETAEAILKVFEEGYQPKDDQQKQILQATISELRIRIEQGKLMKQYSLPRPKKNDKPFDPTEGDLPLDDEIDTPAEKAVDAEIPAAAPAEEA